MTEYEDVIIASGAIRKEDGGVVVVLIGTHVDSACVIVTDLLYE